MRLKLTGNTDNVFETYENEISMHSWEWHWKYLSKSLYNVNKIKSFRDFNPEELIPVWWIDTADFNDQYTLSNRSTVHMSLWYMADVVSFKLITKGRDSVEFYWAQLWYELTNESWWSLDNSIVEKGQCWRRKFAKLIKKYTWNCVIFLYNNSNKFIF